MTLGLADMGRFSEPALLVLMSLAGGDKHGYAIMEEVERDHGIRLGPGTLYGALSRLERRRWIEALAADERRRPYRLTPQGAQVLEEQLRSLQRFVTQGMARLSLT
jgi:DNA-binding PadR family transcriptional regulator